jgi:hypothetical protein
MQEALLALLVIVIIGWGVRHIMTQRSHQKASTPPARALKPYAAVKIQPVKHHACQPAYDASFRVYLRSEAPTLPLRDCGMPGQCRCRYVHYDDRRHWRRRSPNILLPGSADKRERRHQGRRGRRRTD